MTGSLVRRLQVPHEKEEMTYSQMFLEVDTLFIPFSQDH
jgi:hypothetical protein